MRLLKTFIAAAITAALFVLPAGALAKGRDRDHDRMPDKWEKRHHLNTHAKDARKDPDKDGLSNLSEFRHHTDPQKADTDGDGVDDGNEVEDNTDPRRDDMDEVSGTVASFDNGVLTIQLPGDGAGTISGTVTDSTEIECGDENEAPATATASEDGGSDSSGSGSDDGGSDDHSGPGDGTTTPTSTSGSDDGANDENEQTCTTANLVPGARVHEAKLGTSTDGSSVFTKIELVPAG